MTASLFQERYRMAFQQLGMPLKSKHGVPEIQLEQCPQRLPEALHAYYAVAGFEGNLNQAHQHLLPLEKLFVDANCLVFMEENQGVVCWGVRLDTQQPDPVVQQGVYDEKGDLNWFDEHSKCSDFLIAMLYMQATFGESFPYVVSAQSMPEDVRKLEQFWTPVGRIGDMVAYAKENSALTHLKWFDDEWRIFAAFKKHRDQKQAGQELKLEWEDL
jgi:hypothetical protein